MLPKLRVIALSCFLYFFRKKVMSLAARLKDKSQRKLNSNNFMILIIILKFLSVYNVSFKYHMLIGKHFKVCEYIF